MDQWRGSRVQLVTGKRVSCLQEIFLGPVVSPVALRVKPDGRAGGQCSKILESTSNVPRRTHGRDEVLKAGRFNHRVFVRFLGK